MRILLDECMPRRLKRHFRDRGLVLTDVSFVFLRVRSNDITDIEPVLPRLFLHWGELKPRTLLIIE